MKKLILSVSAIIAVAATVSSVSAFDSRIVLKPVEPTPEPVLITNEQWCLSHGGIVHNVPGQTYGTPPYRGRISCELPNGTFR